MKPGKMLKTPKGRLTLALIIFGCSLLFMLSNFIGSIGNLWPSRDRLAAVRDEIGKVKLEYADFEVKLAAQRELESRYNALALRSWNRNELGDPSIGLRALIEKSATGFGMRLNSVGAARTSALDSRFSTVEVDINGTESIELLASFIVDLHQNDTPIYWRRLDLRVGNGANTGKVVFSGTLGVLADHAQEVKE